MKATSTAQVNIVIPTTSGEWVTLHPGETQDVGEVDQEDIRVQALVNAGALSFEE